MQENSFYQSIDYGQIYDPRVSKDIAYQQHLAQQQLAQQQLAQQQFAQ